MTYSVYSITCPIAKQIYFGYTKRLALRLAEHKRAFAGATSFTGYSPFRLPECKMLKPEYAVIAQFRTQSEAMKLETKLIDQGQTHLFLKCLNKPLKNIKHSDATKASISRAKMGRYEGANNPFYGKKHSEASLQRMRDNTNACRVSCEGKEYDSLQAAAKAYNRTSGAMHNRLNSAKPRWSQFFYL